MSPDKLSGQAPFVFNHRKDLSNLPSAAKEQEINLHGGFDIDTRDGYGQIYYGMPGTGIMRSMRICKGRTSYDCQTN